MPFVHRSSWEHRGDVAEIAKSVQGVANGSDTVSSFVSGLNEHIDDARLIVEHKTGEVRKAEESIRPFTGKELEIRR